MTVTGSPRCTPRSDARVARAAASRASCWRWGTLRSSLLAWSPEGSPPICGLWSSGLHMPGAASLANIASRTARSSGVAVRRPSDRPSGPCRLPAEAASSSAVTFLERAVRIDDQFEALREDAELVRAELGGEEGEGGLGVLASGGIHGGRQTPEEAADHLDVIGAEAACPVPGRRCARGAGPGIRPVIARRGVRSFGFVNPSAGVVGGDPQCGGHGHGDGVTDFFGGGMLSQCDQGGLGDYRQASAGLFESAQQGQLLTSGSGSRRHVPAVHRSAASTAIRGASSASGRSMTQLESMFVWYRRGPTRMFRPIN